MREGIQVRSTVHYLAVAGAALAAHGCSRDAPRDTAAVVQAASGGPTTTPIAGLPAIDAAHNGQLIGQLLRQPSALGETTAVHLHLPPPHNPRLANSLVRIVGSSDHPQLVFRSDALAQLGVIDKSPGPDYFTAFSTLSPAELDRMKQGRDAIASGAYGQTTAASVVFEGKHAIGQTTFRATDRSAFVNGHPEPLNRCALRPASSTAAWGKALFITDPAVVQDPARTWDPCSGAGTRGGVWTFAHLMREMATSGTAPEDFVLSWLSLWLNDYAVNGDVVSARAQMFAQVIEPWATASGATATLVTDRSTRRSRVEIKGRLDLDIAPFRLVAIVNRIDRAAQSRDPGYYGSTTTNPGELRFVFTVVQPDPWGGGTDATCGKKPFTVILEYGVPGTSCQELVAWASSWTHLLTYPGFTPAYRSALEDMTQHVVTRGAGIGKGNASALDQIRTNEAALDKIREMREFQLADENPPFGTTASDGPLRPHTVAQTPDDGRYRADGSDPAIAAFVDTLHCDTEYTVPYNWLRQPFLAGNAQIGPGSWQSGSVTSASSSDQICARHQFSLNTCAGCHGDDTATVAPPGSGLDASHVDALGTIPVALSRFLTGGGPGLVFEVPDSQLGAPLWGFAELERRLQRLFDLSHCTPCESIVDLSAEILPALADLGPVPIDPPDPTENPAFKIGPITDLAAVQQILRLRSQFARGALDRPVDFIQPLDSAPE